jgi:hypothetical protein
VIDLVHMRGRRNRGQALVEFLAAAAVLGPMLVGIVLVARLQDLRDTTAQAARYGAFARAFGASAADVESEIRVRYFGPRNVLVHAEDARSGARVDTTSEPQWAEPLRPDQPFVARSTDVTFGASERSPTGAAASTLDGIATTADRLASLTGGRFDVERRGHHDVDVRVRRAPLADLAVTQPLTVRADAHVFGGDWSADGPATTARRATALAPATAVRRLQPILAPFEWALAVFEPAFRDLCLGRVDPELVPIDRLGPVGSGDAGTWVAPCR